MTPEEEEHGEIRHRWLLEQRATQPWVDVLLADDWLEMDSYRPSRDYVFVKYCDDAMIPHLAIASRGWHPLSSWYGPRKGDIPLSIDPYRWKPLDMKGYESIQEFCDWLFVREPWVRPPEPEYDPAGTDVRLTPEPVRLLRAMLDGAVLREKVWQWTNFTIQRSGQAEEKITCRPTDRLRECAFIERIGTLPPGLPRRMLTYDWKITAAGQAWLTANKES